jgi:hypothetical protein
VDYRGWCNQQRKAAISGNTLAISIRSKDETLKALFGSTENKLLMDYINIGSRVASELKSSGKS